MKNLAVFISGGGSNLLSIIDKWKSETVSYDIKLVFSNSSDAFGLTRAANNGIPTKILSHKNHDNRQQYDRNIDQIMRDFQIDFIALAGFMRLLSPWFVRKWSGRLLNIHPSLLPAFPGLHTHQQALDYGVKYAGCSVFFVDEGVDTGSLISQAVVPVLAGDNEEKLAARVLIEEHKIFPQAIENVASGKISLS
jgi:phosphoribosylglycinamide formyltransferase 1